VRAAVGAAVRAVTLMSRVLSGAVDTAAGSVMDAGVGAAVLQGLHTCLTSRLSLQLCTCTQIQTSDAKCRYSL